MYSNNLSIKLPTVFSSDYTFSILTGTHHFNLPKNMTEVTLISKTAFMGNLYHLQILWFCEQPAGILNTDILKIVDESVPGKTFKTCMKVTSAQGAKA